MENRGDTVVEWEHGILVPFLAKWRARVANKLIPAQSRSGRLMDIGCGNYPFSYFLTNTDFSEKYGLDKVFDNTGYQEAANLGLTLVEHDMEANDVLPFHDGQFDVVTMLAVYEHIEPSKLLGIVREIRRILLPGGLFILTTPAFWTDPLLRFMAEFGLVSAGSIAEHKDSYSGRMIRDKLMEAGFDRTLIRVGLFEFFSNNYAVARR